MNARIQQLPADMSAVVLAPLTSIHWDPETDTGSITFDTRRYLSDAAGVVMLPGRSFEGAGSFSTAFEQILTRQFAPAGALDPVTGADLSAVSSAGVMVILKAAFDILYNEQFGVPQ
jgi:hypothetical protein